MGAAGVGHPPQQALDLIALRRGAAGGEGEPPDPVLDGADEARLGVQHPLQHLLKQAGGGGLAVGAGNPDEGQPLPRASEPVGGDQGQGPAGVWGLEPVLPLRGRLPQDGGRPLLQGLPNVVRPVLPGPGQGHEQGARLQGPGVVGYGSNFHVLVRIFPREGDAVQQIPQLQSIHPSRVSFILSKFRSPGLPARVGAAANPAPRIRPPPRWRTGRPRWSLWRRSRRRPRSGSGPWRSRRRRCWCLRPA